MTASLLLYRCLTIIALPFVVLRLLWKVRRDPNYGERWQERFGFFKQSCAPAPVWVHAVSVGEAVAARPVIERLLQNSQAVLVTTTTATGAAQIRRMFGKRVLHVFLPYDYSSAVQRFLRFYKPRVGLIMETELWPNIIAACKSAPVPLFLLNARLSPKSASAYKQIATLTGEMLRSFAAIAAQSQIDAERFIALGADRAKVKVAGSIKFDVEIPDDSLTAGALLRQRFGARAVMVAASTHATEEAMALRVHAQLRVEQPDLLLIIVPRHPERFAEVSQLCTDTGLIVARHSQKPTNLAATNIYLGDTMGELLSFYAAADFAFVGGSFVEVGGHNVLEPAAIGLPAIIGPVDYNCRSIVDLLKEQDAIIQVQNEQEFITAAQYLLTDASARANIGDSARRVVEQNRGAVNTAWNLFAPKLLGAVS